MHEGGDACGGEGRKEEVKQDLRSRLLGRFLFVVGWLQNVAHFRTILRLYRVNFTGWFG